MLTEKQRDFLLSVPNTFGADNVPREKLQNAVFVGLVICGLKVQLKKEMKRLEAENKEFTDYEIVEEKQKVLKRCELKLLTV